MGAILRGCNPTVTVIFGASKTIVEIRNFSSDLKCFWNRGYYVTLYLLMFACLAGLYLAGQRRRRSFSFYWCVQLLGFSDIYYPYHHR